ncbi:MAG: hypothetical protein H7Y38_20860 [Armatimonadetes bacterium]|nr:hypothetical protein [Armatimonadota bacterium]
MRLLPITLTMAAFVAPMPAWAMPQNAVVPVAAPTLAALSVEDFALLKKAVDAVQKYPVALSSDVQVKAVGSGVVMTINETVSATGQFGQATNAPGKFRSDVVLLDEDGKSAAAKFEVVSDGRVVSTHRLSKKEYAEQALGVFRKDFAVPTLGIVCGLIASGDPWGGDDAPADAAGVTAFLDTLKTAGLILESGDAGSGRRLFVMRSADEKTNPFRVSMTVEPASTSFVRMELQTRSGDWKITITEIVRSLAKMPPTTIAPFAPPADAKKVEKVSVLPF